MRGLTCLTAVVISLSVAGAASAAERPSARATVEQAVQNAIAVLKDASIADVERGAKVGTILENHFDFETFSRLAVGQASWKGSRPEHRHEFVREFSKHVLTICRSATNQYGGQDLTVSQDRAEVKGDWTVQTKVIGKKNGAPREVATIDFRLRQRHEHWKVIDVTISGISMAATFRAQFATILKEGGMERAIEVLREKNNATAAEEVAATQR